MLDFVSKKVSVPFLGNRPHHPLADIKRAQQLISELPPYDAIKALEEITSWLHSVTSTDGFKLDYRLKLLELLDHAGKSPQRKLAQEYFATNRPDKIRQNRLATVVFEFWKMLSAAYVQCVAQFQSGAAEISAVKRHLPAIVARAVRALTLQLKWAFQQYGAVDDHIWDDLGRLYLFAETQGFATTVTGIYPEAHDLGTVQKEFLKAMMLSVSSTDSLTPIQQEITERTVAHFCDMYTLHAKQEQNHFFDLATRRRPARTLIGVESNDMTRFFSAGAALLALAQVIREIAAGKSAPFQIDPGIPVESGVMLSAMRHLARYWSDRQPTRRSQRRKVAVSLTVVRSYKQVLKQLFPPAEDNSLDFQVQYASEKWILENINEFGFGATIPPDKGDWIAIGSLLGLQTETSEFWAIGIVRRFASDRARQRHVGIQLLSKAGIPVTLSTTGVASSIKAAREDDPAVLLSTTPDQNSEIDLLMREGSFAPGQAFEMNVRGKRYHLTSSILVEAGNDFDLAKFKVMQRR